MRRKGFSFLFLLVIAIRLQADDGPRIRNLEATEEKGLISVRFELANAFRNQRFQNDLDNGLSTALTYHIELTRFRPNWFDDTLERSRVEVICTFNSSTREYLVNYRRDRMLVRSVTLSDRSRLEEALTSIDERDLFKTEGRRLSRLRVRVRADLGRGYLLSFIPSEVGTNWKQVRVRPTAQP